MFENILLALLGGGNIILFVKFLIERHDRKKEREEDKADSKAEKAEQKELAGIKDRLTKLEKDGLRTQLLLLILLKPEEQTEILRVAEYYFVKLKANWYMTGIFKSWCDARGLKPEWFNPNE